MGDGMIEDINVAGISFEGRAKVVVLLKKEGEVNPKVELRHVKNEYDPYAVGVFCKVRGNERHLGYIPKEMSPQVCRLVRANVVKVAFLTEFGLFETGDGRKPFARLSLVIKAGKK